ncbi:MAG: type II secretion system protein [Planctomycetota bacterium]
MTQNSKQQRSKGFTLIELLVVMGIIALLLAILLPALSKARATTKRVKDSTQVQQVHKGFITLSTEKTSGVFPTPGLIDRVGNTPGKGAEDINVNDHGAMYAACIMQGAFDTNVLVSPAEISTNVLTMANYNYDAYNVVAAQDQYWDPLFKADLAAISNVSYGTLLLNGTRKTKEWKQTLNSKFPVLANRGIQCNDADGSIIPANYNASKTLQIHGGAKQWEGNVGFNDNHVSYEEKFQPDNIQQITVGTTTQDDNIFAQEGGLNGADSYLCVCKSVTGGGTTYNFNITCD